MKKILQIAPHVGGGIGTVLLSWMEKVKGHTVICLDYANDKWKKGIKDTGNYWADDCIEDMTYISDEMARADVVVVHFWDHPMLQVLFSRPIPPCRLVFWTHKDYAVPQKEKDYPDLFLNVSPVQGKERYIWSCGNMGRFLAIQPRKHKGFNVGTVCSPKLHPGFMLMCHKIGLTIPEAHFMVLGESEHIKPRPPWYDDDKRCTFTGKVDDIAPYMAEMDVWGYPLRTDHYGTCEQVLGEAMAAGVVPVVMDNPAERLIVTDGVDGFIAKTEAEYVACIEFLYRYPAIRAHLAFNARQRAEKLYSVDKMVRQWDEVFEEIMQQPKKERRPL